MRIKPFCFSTLSSLALLICQSYAQEYTVKKESDGPFQFKIAGTLFNKHSSLERESILLNYPNSPVVVISNSLRIDKKDDEYTYFGSTDLKFNTKIMAVSVTHAIYDVFGRHVENLENIEIRDFDRGWATFKSEWTADQDMFGEEVHEQLTTVTYVNRVRMNDGTVWTYDKDRLLSALSSLNLEKNVENETKE